MPCKGSDMHSDVWGDDSPCASTDQKDDLDREWRSRQEKFKNEGYREGFDAGKEVTVQEGFDNGQSHRQQQQFFHRPCFLCITHRSPFLPLPLHCRLHQRYTCWLRMGFHAGISISLRMHQKNKTSIPPKSIIINNNRKAVHPAVQPSPPTNTGNNMCNNTCII